MFDFFICERYFLLLFMMKYYQSVHQCRRRKLLSKSNKWKSMPQETSGNQEQVWRIPIPSALFQTKMNLFKNVSSTMIKNLITTVWSQPSRNRRIFWEIWETKTQKVEKPDVEKIQDKVEMCNEHEIGSHIIMKMLHNY